MQETSDRSVPLALAPFLNVYRAATGEKAVNGIHCDAHEFMVTRYDLLDNYLTARNVPNILRRIFMGNLTNARICPEGHLATREETFFQITVGIENEDNLDEASPFDGERESHPQLHV